MIPKLLHIAWVGEDGTAPDGCIDSWRTLNPDFDVRVWGNAELSAGPWRTRAQMKALLPRDLNAVMECLRYEALATHCGIAVDALTLAASPIPGWLLETDVFATWADELDEPGTLSTALLGARPGHPFFDRLVADIAATEGIDRDDPRSTVGAQRLTDTWRATRHPLTVYPSHYMATTYGDEPSYRGGGLVIAELLRPPREQDADSGGTTSAGFAISQGETAQRLVFPTHIEGAPPLTSSFDLPPVLPPADSSTFDTMEHAVSNPSESLTWADIAAQIREVPAVPTPVSAPTSLAPRAGVKPSSTTGRFRVVVATDWSSATIPMAVLRAYAEIIPTTAPVDLVFAVDHDPSEEDAACVKVLLEGIQDVDTAGLTVESFAEVARKSCYAAVVPNGDANALIMELSRAIVTLHHLADVVRDERRLGKEPTPVDGPNAGLQRRLAAFREVALTSA